MDYYTRFRPMHFLTGSLNVQSLHHTMPGVASAHYFDLYPKFHALCVKHNCEPPDADNIFNAIWKHFLYIWRLGSDSEHLTATDGKKSKQVLL